MSTGGGGGDEDSLESGASSDSLLREIARIDDSAGDARLPGSRIGRFVVELAAQPGEDFGPIANDEIVAFTTAREGSADDVRRALARRSSGVPMRESFEARVVLGEAALRLGMTDAAIELLRPAARSCLVYSPYKAIDYLFSRVHARFDLGEALAASGDTAGACASYAQVVAQWGNATPRSVTAEKAKARQAALHCPK